MNRITRIVAGTLVSAATLGVYAGVSQYQPAMASAAPQHKVTVHSLEGAIVKGQGIEIDGVTYVARPVTHHKPVTENCQFAMQAVEQVARQTGLNIGTGRLPFQGASPRTVARELRRGASGQGEPMKRYLLSAAGVASDLWAHRHDGFPGDQGAVVAGWFMQAMEFAAASCEMPVRPF